MENFPSLRQIQYFMALARFRSFSRAARDCNVTQSSFSAGIAALEALLGQPLINRHSRKLTLTAAGEEALSKIPDLLEKAADLMASASHRGEILTGPMRLGIIPTIAPYMLPLSLPLLKQAWPQLNLHLHEDLSDRLVDKLNAGRLDAALLAFPFSTPGLRQTILFREDFVFASSRAQKSPMTQGELDDEELLLLEEGHCLRAHALSACRAENPNIRKTFSTTSLQTLIQMVAHGFGSTLLPAMAARPGTLPETVYIRRFENPAPYRDIGLVWRNGNPRDADIEALGGTIKSCLQKQGSVRKQA